MTSNAEQQRDYRARRKAGLIVAKAGRPPSAEHGSESRYVDGCRCEECKASASAARRARRGKQRPGPDGEG